MTPAIRFVPCGVETVAVLTTSTGAELRAASIVNTGDGYRVTWEGGGPVTVADCADMGAAEATVMLAAKALGYLP